MTPDTHPIRIAVAGAGGKMGAEAVRTLSADPRFHVDAVLVRTTGQAPLGWTGPYFTDAATLMTTVQPDVWLDFTDADSVVQHTDLAIEHGIRPVVGATGYAFSDIDRWNKSCTQASLGGLAAPNFALGALLMTRFAAEAARFFPTAEIIELHHDGKKDAPSGTAKRTAAAMARALQEGATGVADGLLSGPRGSAEAHAAENPARGQRIDGIPVHSIRLPGLVAHQEVIFGGVGEVLSIRHDSTSRSSFMPGVALACARVMHVRGMIYGLEHLLW